MIKEKSNFLGEVLDIRNALANGDDASIEQIISNSARPDSLQHSLRYALCNYTKEIAGADHDENVMVWGVPVVLKQNANDYISTVGSSREIFESNSRVQLRKYFGAEYSPTVLAGLLHSDMLSAFDVSVQSNLFGRLASMHQGDTGTPALKISKGLADRIDSGLVCELAFIVGAVSRFQRVPEIRKRDTYALDKFKLEMQGRIDLYSQQKTGYVGNVICGSPDNFADAYEDGIKLLIKHISDTCETGQPVVVASSAIDYCIKYDVLTSAQTFCKREINLKGSLIGLEGLKRVFEYAASVNGHLSLAKTKGAAAVMH